MIKLGHTRYFPIIQCLLAGVVLIAGAPLSEGAATELKLAHWMSPRHVMHSNLMAPWAKEVAAKSDGKLTVQIFPGGALGKGPVAQFQRAVDGVADITFGLPGFTSSQFRRTGVIELPMMTESSVDGTNKLWNALDKELAPEWSRVKILGLWSGEPQILLMQGKPIRTMADFKGMKIRTPSKVQADVIAALGGTPVPMPIDQVYNALSTGVIDGALTGPSTIQSFKLGEVTKYITIGLPLGRSPFFMVMNKDAYGKLSAVEKSVIDATTGRPLSLKAAEAYEAEADEIVKAARTGGKQEVITFSADDQKKTVAVLKNLRNELAQEMEKDGVPAKAILTAMGIDL